MKHIITYSLLALLLATSVSAATLTIRPDGQGNYRQWKNVGCSSGNNEWQCVDETTLDTSDYLRTSSSSRRETFTFGNTGLTTESVNSVTMHYVAMRHNHNGNRCFEATTRSGGANFDSGTQLCAGNSWEEKTHTFTTNPATGNAWTVAEVDALEAGMRGRNPDGGGRIAQVWATVDFTVSAFCGNNQTEGNETCDGTDLNNETCQSQGFDGGTLGCQSSCNAFDTGGCFNNPVCGNNQTEGNETCDGTDLNGQACSTQGFDGGTLACASTCNAFDTSSCFTNTCTSTDGSDIFVAGTTFGSSRGTPFNHSDTCVANNVVFEWSCFSTSPVAFNRTCPAGNQTNTTGLCVSGACV